LLVWAYNLTAEKALKRANRRVSRRQKGSHRRKKAAKLCAKKCQKVKRQRRDFHHKTALLLMREYDAPYFEDLRGAHEEYVTTPSLYVSKSPT
jgi:putative transposase